MADRKITLEWHGVPYAIPENQTFELMDAIERHVTLPELLTMVGTGRPNYSQLARAYKAMLTFCGIKDVPEAIDLRRMMVSEGFANIAAAAGKSPAPITQNATAAIGAMIEILSDGAEMPGAEPEGGDEKKSKPRSRKPASKSRSGSGA